MYAFTGVGLAAGGERTDVRQKCRRQRAAYVSLARRFARSSRTKMCVEADVEQSGSISKKYSSKLPVPTLMLVLPEYSINDLGRTEALVASAVEGGVNVVQVRETTENYEGMDEAVEALSSKFPDVVFLVNSNIEVASKFTDVGIHLPEALCKFHGVARERTSESKTIGSSVHSVPAAEKATESGADYLIVGTIFDSASHPNKTPEGILMLKMVRRAIGEQVPMIAIGGVTPDNVSSVLDAGASGVAVMRGIVAADDVAETARKYMTAMKEHLGSS